MGVKSIMGGGGCHEIVVYHQLEVLNRVQSSLEGNSTNRKKEGEKKECRFEIILNLGEHNHVITRSRHASWRSWEK